jgi:hypothetical protein
MMINASLSLSTAVRISGSIGGRHPPSLNKRKRKKQWLLEEMFDISSKRNELIARVRDRVAFGWGMLALTCFEESGSWWFFAGFSDYVSHILVGVYNGCCSRTVTRGLDSPFDEVE